MNSHCKLLSKASASISPVCCHDFLLSLRYLVCEVVVVSGSRVSLQMQARLLLLLLSCWHVRLYYLVSV